MPESRTYLPAAGHGLLLPLYDPFTRLLGADKARRALIDQAQLSAGHRVLEVGCGTGSVLVRTKQLHPSTEVTGLDPDPKALARAKRKARRSGVDIRLDRGFADALRYEDSSFDRVLSSFMFHHLPRDQKAAMLTEIRRVLAPGGRFEMVDLARSEHAGGLTRFLHAPQLLHENAEETVLSMLHEAGLADARVVERRRMLLGPIVFYQASRARTDA